ncbi:HD domain-containing protein [Sulfurimonas sp.]
MVEQKCRYINDIINAKVRAVYEVDNYIEIVYEQEMLQKSFTIEQQCHFGPMHDGCWFNFGGVALPAVLRKKKQLSTRLSDIDSVVEINKYVKKLYNGAYVDLEIIYKDKDGVTQSYLLHPQPHEEEVHEIVLLKNQKSNFEAQEKCKDEQMLQELYSTAVYKNALAFALKAHGEQKTPDGLPYAFHIVSVANEIINSLSMHKIPYDEANVAISCALLHDVHEDTQERVSKYTVKLPHIDSIVWGVEALTKDTSLPNKVKQMSKSLKALQNQPKCVQMVKLADRITNLAPAPLFWNRAKRKAYVEEAKQILKALSGANLYLEQKLQNKIENYNIDRVLDSDGFPMKDDFLVFFVGEQQLVLDKNHKKYLKTFKALNRLSEYVKKEYDLTLFDNWLNRDELTLAGKKDRLGINYITQVLNTKDLLNLNKQTDDKIAKFITLIYEGEGCIV